jgi:hypothetical protein
MGLDAFHRIPSSVILDSEDFFYVSQLEQNPVFLSRFSSYVKEREEKVFDFEILVFRSEEIRNICLNHHPYLRSKPSLVGVYEQLEEKIKQVAKEHNIHESPAFTTQPRDMTMSQKHNRIIDYTKLVYQAGTEMVKVLYYKQLGYQRKGMTKGFYETFGSPFYCWEKKDVLLAASFLETDSSEKFRQDFISDFVNNFVEGESIFLGSY